MTKLICIDAGHGGTDPGAVNGSKREAVAALAIARKVGAKLIDKGYKVIFTRKEDKYVSLADRCKLSNAREADAFVSIHLNAATNKEAAGIETWRYEKVGALTKSLASNVQTELISATGAKDRGVKTTTTLYVLKRTVAPAILIECGFISNNAEATQLFSGTYQDKLACAIVSGIEKSIK
jgi:N-acetylmuramoyl-L-alanine amidase